MVKLETLKCASSKWNGNDDWNFWFADSRGISMTQAICIGDPLTDLCIKHMQDQQHCPTTPKYTFWCSNKYTKYFLLLLRDDLLTSALPWSGGSSRLQGLPCGSAPRDSVSQHAAYPRTHQTWYRPFAFLTACRFRKNSCVAVLWKNSVLTKVDRATCPSLIFLPSKMGLWWRNAPLGEWNGLFTKDSSSG